MVGICWRRPTKNGNSYDERPGPSSLPTFSLPHQRDTARHAPRSSSSLLSILPSSVRPVADARGQGGRAPGPLPPAPSPYALEWQYFQFHDAVASPGARGRSHAREKRLGIIGPPLTTPMPAGAAACISQRGAPASSSGQLDVPTAAPHHVHMALRYRHAPKKSSRLVPVSAAPA